jgi:phosphohistidine phosphatase
MDLTVIRHGTAEDRASRDADRPLTSAGREEARQAGARLAQLASPPDLIIASPYARALETARLVARALGYPGEVTVDPALTPDASPEGVRALLAGLGHHDHVLLVAHEPLLSATCALLLGIAFPPLGRAEIVGMRRPGAEDPRSGHFTLRFRS